jgi:hypothetical protein
MKDNIIFKLLSKEHICGKTRNIYIKMNKNSSRITKTKFIKYKGDFVKLSTFLKEYYKDNKQHNNYKNKVTIINVNDIKDVKIKKLYKKNAKIYIFTENSKKGGGPFRTDVLKNGEDGITRTIISKSDDNKKIKIKYDEKIDDIIVEIENILNNHEFNKIINNFWYYIGLDNLKSEYVNERCVIRPHIKYFNYNKIIIDFYFSIDNKEWVDWDKLNDNWDSFKIDPNIKRGTPYGGRKWIKMPIHITLFLSVTKKQGWMGEYYISKHIHITSEKIKNFNIKTANNLKVINNKTHTYLIANNLDKMLDIMNEHGKNIFKDWVYDKNVSQTNSKIEILCPFPKSREWTIMNPTIKENLNFQIFLTENEKKLLCECINNSLYLIIYDIINNLIQEYVDVAPGQYNRHDLYTPQLYYNRQLMIVNGSGCTIDRTYNDATYNTREPEPKIEFIKFNKSEDSEDPNKSYASYINHNEIERESLVTLENSLSARTDSPSLRDPSGSSVRTDSSSFRSPDRSRRTDSSSFRSPDRSRRTDSSSFRSPERTASIMGTLGTAARTVASTATRTAFDTFSSIASSAIPRGPARIPSARDRTPVRRPH